jgi:RHS repeat-associated protein
MKRLSARLYTIEMNVETRIYFRDLFEHSSDDYTTRAYFYAFGERFAVRIEEQSILRAAWMPPAGTIPLPSGPAAFGGLALLTLGALAWRSRHGDLDLVFAHPTRAGVAILAGLALLPHPAWAGGGDGSGTGYYRYLYTDHLGSEVLVTTEAGDVVQRRVFEPFGKVFADSTTETGRQRFALHEREEASGLFLTPARAYDPDAGRFLSVDPILARPLDPEQLNPYAYVRNNPVSFVDPSGGFVEWGVAGSFVGIVVSGLLQGLAKPAVDKSLSHRPKPNAMNADGGAPDPSGLSLAQLENATSSPSLQVNASGAAGTKTRVDEAGAGSTIDQSQGAQSRHYDLSFNGTTLELYGEEGGIAGKWEGVSGRPGFQDPAYQWLPDNGPLPEGYYLARQSRLEQFPTGVRGAVQEALGLVGRGQWPGGRIAWGDYRVWLEPIRGTDPLGRSGFSIHGGLFPGTRGCIDLCGGMSSFVDAFRATGRDLVLRVQYPGGP